MKTEVGKIRFMILRGLYLLIGIGLILTIWPGIFSNAGKTADSHTVVSAILGAASILALVGVLHPLKMLPVLLFELLWKAIWFFAFAVPLWLGEGLDAYAKSNLFAVILGLILTPAAIPWGYVLENYIRSKP